MHQREYLRLKKTIEDEYRQKLSALDMVWKMAAAPTKNGEKGQQSEGAGRGSETKKAVLEIMPGLVGKFNQNDVLSRIKQANPETASVIKRASLSMALKKICETGDIRLVEKGSGKRPTIYER